MQVTNNGPIALDETLTIEVQPGFFGCCPTVFPPGGLEEETVFLTPFWSDVYTTNGNGTVWRRSTTTDTVAINKVKSLVETHFKMTVSEFVPTEVSVMTWDHVEGFDQSNAVS